MHIHDMTSDRQDNRKFKKKNLKFAKLNKSKNLIKLGFAKKIKLNKVKVLRFRTTKRSAASRA